MENTEEYLDGKKLHVLLSCPEDTYLKTLKLSGKTCLFLKNTIYDNFSFGILSNILQMSSMGNIISIFFFALSS